MYNLLKEPIKIPKKFAIKIINEKLLLKSKLGCKKIKIYNQIIIQKNKIFITNQILLHFLFKHKIKKGIMEGTFWSLTKQAFLGISSGFRKNLKIVGVGYKVALQETFGFQILKLKLGYSHLIEIKIPKSLKVIIPDEKINKFFIFGIDKQKVNQLAAFIRAYKKPEPYKGKGILYKAETIVLKEGKRS